MEPLSIAETVHRSVNHNQLISVSTALPLLPKDDRKYKIAVSSACVVD